MTLQHACNFQKKCAFRFAFIAFISLCITLLSLLQLDSFAYLHKLYNQPQYFKRAMNS